LLIFNRIIIYQFNIQLIFITLIRIRRHIPLFLRRWS